MSIRFIGEKYRDYSGNKNKFLSRADLQAYDYIKKAEQDAYKDDLERQIHIQNAKKREDKERELMLDRLYQKMYVDQIQYQKANYFWNYKRPAPLYWSYLDKNTKNPESYQYSFPLPSANHPYKTPNLQRKWRNLLFQTTKNQLRQNESQNKRYRVHETEAYLNADDSPRVEKGQNLSAKIEEQREEFRRNLNKKAGEVYWLMNQSIETLSNTNNIGQLKSNSSKAKVGRTNKYQIKSPLNSHKSRTKTDPANYPTITQNILPLINKPINAETQNVDNEWRKWYAEQKLKQIEATHNHQVDYSPKRYLINRSKSQQYSV